MTVDSDDWNQHWQDYGDAVAANPAQTYRRRLVLDELAGGAPPARIVDIGSGTGDQLADIARQWPDAELLGLELSDTGVEIGRRKVASAQFRQCDLSQPVSPGALQGWATHAVCTEVLEHVDDPVTFLRNASAFLGPDCRVVVTVPGGPRSAFDRHIGHRRHYTADDLRTMLEASNFEVEEAGAAGFPFFNLYRLIVIARGKRLITDVAEAEHGEPTATGAARLLMRAFDVLFRFNLTRSRFGWQTFAVARPRATA